MRRSRSASRSARRRSVPVKNAHRQRRAVFEALESRMLLAVLPLTYADQGLSGISAFGSSSTPSMSADGQLVVFQSDADNIVPNDTNGQSDVFLYNRAVGSVSLISVALDGTAAGRGSQYTSPVISPDGRYVAFESSSTNPLVASITGDQMYLRDLQTGKTSLLTPNAAGTGGASIGVYGIEFTGDSRHVLFVSTASFANDLAKNLTDDPVTPGVGNIFLRNLITNQTELVSVDGTGTGVGIRAGGGVFYTVNFASSADGRYVAFTSGSTSLILNDINNSDDVFVRDTLKNVTLLVSADLTGHVGLNGNSGQSPLSISADGRFVVFTSEATGMTTVNPNGGRLAYIRDMQLGVTKAISVKPDQTIPNFSTAADPQISADGSKVIFVESAGLLAQDTNNKKDVYAYDRVSQALSLVSINAGNTNGGNADSGTFVFLGAPALAITPDGHYAFFRSGATDLVNSATVTNQNLYRRDLQNPGTSLVSTSTAGNVSANADVDTIAISDDGRYVAFQSSAPNLVVNDNNFRQDIFVRDMTSNSKVVASLASPLLPGRLFDEYGGTLTSASADGHFVVFTSQDGVHNSNGFGPFPPGYAPELNVPSGIDHVLLRDTQTGFVSYIDVNPLFTQAVGGDHPLISADGKFVYFESSGNLDSQHPNTTGRTEVYYRDLTTGVTTLASRTPAGAPSAGSIPGNRDIAISKDGRYVVWKSNATDLVAGTVDNSGGNNLFLFDRTNGSVKLLSHATGSATQSGNNESRDAVFSPDGSKIAFASRATNLVNGITDGNNDFDLFVYDIGTTNITLASAKTGGGATGDKVSGDPDSLASTNFVFSSTGQYLFFASNATNLVATDTNGKIDIYRRDLTNNTTLLISPNAAGTDTSQRDSYRFTISSDGQKVAFSSWSNNLVAGQTKNDGGDNDVYVRDIGANSTTLVSAIPGSATATGDHDSDWPVISPDGRYVSFRSKASNLVAGFVDANGLGGDDLFLRDLQTGKTTLVSANQAGTAGGKTELVAFDQNDVRLFSTTNTLVFNSTTPDLIPGDRNLQRDLFAFMPAGSATISGRVFSDENGNTTLDNGETGVRDFTVYLDTNTNNQLDPGEPRLQTDPNGNYTFNNLGLGTYVVRAQVQSAYQPTAPAGGSYSVSITTEGQTITAKNFGERLLRPDLTVTTVSNPQTSRIGGSITVNWTVKNNGVSTVGAWQDAIFISPTPTLGNTATLLATVSHTGGLANGAQYNGTANVTLPSLPVGSYTIFVQTDRRNQITADNNKDNNLSTNGISLTTQALTIGADYSADSFTAPGQQFLYRIDVPADSGSMTLKLTSAAASGATAMYLRRGLPPTAWDYDFASTANQPNQSLLNPTTPAGTYYLLVRAESGAAATAGFTLRADLPTGLHFLSTDRAGSGKGLITLAITGLNMTPTTTAQLQMNLGVITAATVDFRSASLIYVTFDLTLASLGIYSLRLEDNLNTSPEGFPFTVSNVLPDADPLVLTLDTPAAVRHHGQVYPAVIEFANNGPFDIPAPLLQFTVQHARLKLPNDVNFTDSFDESTVQFQATADDSPVGIIRAGASGKQIVYFQPGPDGADFDVNFQVGVIQPNEPIDWAGMKDSLRPSYISIAAWDAIYNNLLAIVGSTTDDYNTALSQAQFYLANLGDGGSSILTANTAQLWGFLLAQANVQFPLPVLSTVTDAAVSTPGLPLSLSRDFLQPISGRNRFGLFGYGWGTVWDTSLSVDQAGNVTIDAGGAIRFFALQPDGTYNGGAAEYGTLARSGSIYTLTEKTGDTSVFLANGKLDYVADTNGNRITLGYTAGRLTTLTHNSGQALTLAYNSNGLVSQVTDGAGRVTQYFYETADLVHLTKVVDPQGTTLYKYITGQEPADENALSQITFPDGTNTFFGYDGDGRLTDVHRDGGAEDLTFAYSGNGIVTTIDALGKASTTYFNAAGQPARVVDGNQNATNFSYDTNFNLVRTIDPLGQQYNYAYDTLGNLSSIVNPLGQTTTLAYTGDLSRLAQLTDAKGNTTKYDYDGHGNLLSITYPGGGSEAFTYDPLGNLTDTLNRRGHAIHNTYDTRGRITKTDFADGTSQTFTYDNFDNLLTATDPGGTITLKYTVPADNRLTEIDYPGNRFLKFTYDTGGRRTQSVDQDGFTVKYIYDAAGRLSKLTDGAVIPGLIVQYTYDDAGNLMRKDNGNGTYTKYLYDPANRIIGIENYKSGTTLNSHFYYTYDAAGRVITSTSDDGVTTYGYDAIGQLTSVELPGGRTIAYTYDAAGNRAQVVDSLLGTMVYTVNNENEITKTVNTLGTTVTTTDYTYDADGNLHTTTDASGTTTYTFNDLNQLKAVTAPAGNSAYTYNALGDRTAVTVGGQTTSYLIDPVGLGNVVAAYGNAGALINHFVHGLGLVSQTGPAGGGYYDFDLTGNTVGISSSGIVNLGQYVNRYGYLPFGETTATIAAALPNPFTFVGKYGVMHDPTGLSFMRARYYSPTTAHFISKDPIGLSGGDANLRRYAGNDPISQRDPSGLVLSPEQQQESDEEDSSLQKLIDEGVRRERKKELERLQEEYRRERQAERIDKAIRGRNRARREEQLAQGEFNFRLLPPFLQQLITLERFIFTVGSVDPNDLLGPAGFGPEHFAEPLGAFSYMIEFENTATATAPAQEVVVTHTVNSNLDYSTFELTSFSFGPVLVNIPPGLKHYETTVDFHNPDNSPLSIDCTFDFNPVTGLFKMTLLSINPATGSLPLDAFAGFLPPNDDTKRGQGFVTYTAHPKTGLPDGTQILQNGVVYFDGSPLATPDFINTTDLNPPTSSVKAISALENTDFTVKWTGTDGGGSGIAAYDVYLKHNGDPFTKWQSATTDTSAPITGALPGDTYAFYVVAIDNLGHSEAVPASPDWQTTISDRPWQNAEIQFDVTHDGTVTPLDAQEIVNEINAHKSHQLAPTKPSGALFLDVFFDGFVRPSDAVEVVNFLNFRRRHPEGKGEGELVQSPPAIAPIAQAAAGVSADLVALLAADISAQPKRRNTT